MTSHRDTLLEVKEALEACGEQLALLAKDPANNPCVKQAKQALAKLDTLLEAPPADMVEGVQKAILDVWARRPKWERLGPLTRRQAEAAILAMPAFSWKGWDADAPSKIVDEYHALFEAPPADRVERVRDIVYKYKHGSDLKHAGTSFYSDAEDCATAIITALEPARGGDEPTPMSERALSEQRRFIQAACAIGAKFTPPSPHPYHPSPNYPGYEERINEEGHLETRPSSRRTPPPESRDNNATGNGDTAACGESGRSAVRSDEAAVEGVDEEVIHKKIFDCLYSEFGVSEAGKHMATDILNEISPYLRQPVDIEAGARAIDPSAFGLGLANNVSLTMQHIARSHAKACATAWGLTYVD
jgi:hypothetical protein